MQANHINPFLQSSMIVIEQTCNVKPSLGEIKVKTVEFIDNMIWLRIGIKGHVQGDVVFGFPEQVALRLVSAMMGGFDVTEMDAMSQSAISELGNMISGNASTIFYNDGIKVDITPPNIITDDKISVNKAVAVPIRIEGIGEFTIYVVALQDAS